MAEPQCGGFEHIRIAGLGQGLWRRFPAHRFPFSTVLDHHFLLPMKTGSPLSIPSPLLLTDVLSGSPRLIFLTRRHEVGTASASHHAAWDPWPWSAWS